MHILAMDIGGTAIKTAVFTERGQIIKEKEFQAVSCKGADYLIQQIFDIISSYNGIDRIGVSSSGQIDSKTGCVLCATESIPGWTGVKLKEIIEEEFCIPTMIENDVNAMAIGEAYYGEGNGYNSFLCLAYGTGIGGAIFLNGEIIRGHSGSAAEFGHIITHAGGRRCACGSLGCYEAYASTKALVSNVNNTLGEALDGRAIFDKAKSDIAISNLIDDWIKEVVYGLVSLMYVFNPNLIILGGGVMEQNDLLNPISYILNKSIMSNYRDVKIVNSKHGNKSALYGVFHTAVNKNKY